MEGIGGEEKREKNRRKDSKHFLKIGSRRVNNISSYDGGSNWNIHTQQTTRWWYIMCITCNKKKV